jgi:aspartyl-tRNA(Asn)/glutamyl-tRNA(Gln) amidotransferase subunit A
MGRPIPARPTTATRDRQRVTETAPPTIEQALTRLRDGTLTSVRLTRDCLDTIERLNGQLNAFIAVTADEALERAREADLARSRGQWLGPLHGIPVSLKDLIDQRGVGTTAGSRVLDATPAAKDAPVTAALRQAGAVLIGKCNLHEFAFGTTSDESAFGPVRHPQDPGRAAGGSSGGSAVAVATGLSLASIGTDTGGSIRIPAAACGIVGLKPCSGEVSCEGVVPLSRSLDHVGPLCRTVADAALVHGALTRTEPVRPTAGADLRSARLGVPYDFLRDRVQPPVRDCFDRSCEALAAAGATLAPIRVEELELAAAAYLALVLPEAAEWHAAHLNRHPDRYSPGVRIRLEAGRYVLAEDYLRAQALRSRLTDAIDASFATCDAIALPALAITPEPVFAATVRMPRGDEPVRAAMLRLTQPFNMSGHPAISIPCGRTSDGWPCGFQLVGRRGDTRGLLTQALACEPHLT